jgi:predicted outer membrane protein
VRLEYPYLDKRGGKCGKLAFGRSMGKAYSRLEKRVAKDHSDKLEEFKKAYGEEAFNLENPHTVSSPADKVISREQ